jgi:hypothetical protein
MEQMNITSAQYYVSEMSGQITSVNCTIDGQQMSIPLDPDNRHYAEIMRQVEAGELTIEPADENV